MNWMSSVLIVPIRFYQRYISPLTPPACRFTPTCSQYAIEAIQEHGALKGSWLAVRRILRCHPWGGSGYDPVPKRQDKKNLKVSILDLLVAGLLCIGIQPVVAQRIAVKTNGLYDLTLSPSVGLELRALRRTTLNLEFTASVLTKNPVMLGNGLRHVQFAPEVRWWLDGHPMQHHFLGVMGVGALYNFRWNDTDHDGDAAGLGMTYGYDWMLSRHWNLEATAGFGMLWIRDNDHTGTVSRFRPAPLKLGLSISYIIK